MYSSKVLLVFLHCYCYYYNTLALPTAEESLYSKHWFVFKAQYGRQYENSSHEHERYEIFKENFARIEEHNKQYDAGLVSFQMEINQFADMSKAEFRQFANGHSKEQSHNLNYDLNKYYDAVASKNGNVPMKMDWRRYGAVTEVKNQGSCGSCWTFSATGALEGHYKNKYNRLISLSEQNLLDCTRQYHNEGCNGGRIYETLLYVEKYGIESEREYPYEHHENRCRYNPSKVVVKAKDVVYLPPGNETALQEAIGLMGPISIVLNANNEWQFYKQGIYWTETCTDGIWHAVLAVGYDTENGYDYYIVKNSWGKDWGDNGYIKIARNTNGKCGLPVNACYPIV